MPVDIITEMRARNRAEREAQKTAEDGAEEKNVTEPEPAPKPEPVPEPEPEHVHEPVPEPEPPAEPAPEPARTSFADLERGQGASGNAADAVVRPPAPPKPKASDPDARRVRGRHSQPRQSRRDMAETGGYTQIGRVPKRIAQTVNDRVASLFEEAVKNGYKGEVPRLSAGRALTVYVAWCELELDRTGDAERAVREAVGDDALADAVIAMRGKVDRDAVVAKRLARLEVEMRGTRDAAETAGVLASYLVADRLALTRGGVPRNESEVPFTSRPVKMLRTRAMSAVKEGRMDAAHLHNEAFENSRRKSPRNGRE